MSLRALASLLARRLSARGAQAPRSAAAAGTRPAKPRALRTLIENSFTRAQRLTLPSISAQRDLGVGHGALALTSSLAGLLLGFLYFKQDRDDSAWEYTRKEEETVKWRDVIEPSVRAKFTRKDGTFAYPEYYGYLRVQMNGGKPNYDQKCSDKEEAIVDDDAADTDEDDNNAAHRYENFKKVVKALDKFNAERGTRSSLLAPLAPNELADYSQEELDGLGTLADESHWEGYLDHVHTMIARGNDIRHNENACEAVKKFQKEKYKVTPEIKSIASLDAAAPEQSVFDHHPRQERLSIRCRTTSSIIPAEDACFAELIACKRAIETGQGSQSVT
uniref:Cathepsin propeptide inhibitor domain-containing protein n=1 Tax=Oryza rufipogon TaxID=4529 RepID=A0A0E0QB54_ORYRU